MTAVGMDWRSSGGSESRSRAAGEAMSGGAVAWFTCVREIITESY